MRQALYNSVSTVRNAISSAGPIIVSTAKHRYVGNTVGTLLSPIVDPVYDTVRWLSAAKKNKDNYNRDDFEESFHKRRSVASWISFGVIAGAAIGAGILFPGVGALAVLGIAYASSLVLNKVTRSVASYTAISAETEMTTGQLVAGAVRSSFTYSENPTQGPVVDAVLPPAAPNTLENPKNYYVVDDDDDVVVVGGDDNIDVDDYEDFAARYVHRKFQKIRLVLADLKLKSKEAKDITLEGLEKQREIDNSKIKENRLKVEEIFSGLSNKEHFKEEYIDLIDQIDIIQDKVDNRYKVRIEAYQEKLGEVKKEISSIVQKFETIISERTSRVKAETNITQIKEIGQIGLQDAKQALRDLQDLDLEKRYPNQPVTNLSQDASARINAGTAKFQQIVANQEKMSCIPEMISNFKKFVDDAKFGNTNADLSRQKQAILQKADSVKIEIGSVCTDRSSDIHKNALATINQIAQDKVGIIQEKISDIERKYEYNVKKEKEQVVSIIVGQGQVAWAAKEYKKNLEQEILDSKDITVDKIESLCNQFEKRYLEKLPPNLKLSGEKITMITAEYVSASKALIAYHSIFKMLIEFRMAPAEKLKEIKTFYNKPDFGASLNRNSQDILKKFEDMFYTMRDQAIANIEKQAKSSSVTLGGPGFFRCQPVGQPAGQPPVQPQALTV